MPNITRPMSRDRSPMYDGTAQELDRQLQHGQALMTVVRCAKHYVRWTIGEASGSNFPELCRAVAALEALEER